jgi:hypothetical protein
LLRRTTSSRSEYIFEKSEYIFEKSKGRMSEIIQPIARCAIWAINDKTECISMNHLKRYKFAA